MKYLLASANSLLLGRASNIQIKFYLEHFFYSEELLEDRLDYLLFYAFWYFGSLCDSYSRRKIFIANL